MQKKLLASLGHFFLFISIALAAPVKDVITIESGVISGFTAEGENSLHVYKGIPYAVPPVGKLRWKPPKPPMSWDSVRSATEPGPWCPQPESIIFSGYSGLQEEDCLYLNIWTPAKDTEEKRPVMLWIHGGDSTIGSGSVAAFDGRRLAGMGIVVVTINYRLGPLGYLAHPLLSKESEKGVSGNYGFLDQIASLKWVKRNIAAFGGNPDNVTIFGGSAGALAVTRLMVSPLADGLFHRAIAQSGGSFGLNIRLREKLYGLESAEEIGESVSELLGVSYDRDVLAAMRTKSPDEIMKAAKPSQGLYGSGIRFGPIVDGWSIPADPGILFLEGKIMNVPFLTGANADEGSIFLGQSPIKDPNGYKYIIQLYGREHASDLLRLFPAKSAKEIKSALNKYISVSSFIAPARGMVRAVQKHQPNTYLYHFTRVSPIKDFKQFGAFHGSEIIYAFGNLGSLLGNVVTDRNLSDKMVAYWTNFAKTGNPNGEGLPKWPAYQTATDQHLELGAKIKIGSGLYREACDIFEDLMQTAIKSR